MGEKLEPVSAQYSMKKDFHIVSMKPHSNVTVIGMNWPGVVRRCDERLGLILPVSCPIPSVNK